MIADLKPYPVMKDSGVEWIGEVPVHWSTPRTKTCFRLSIEKSGQNHGMELLSIYTHIGVRPRKDLEEKGNKASTTNDYWVVRVGDIICNKLLAWMGAIGVSHYNGVTSPAYDILRPIVPLEPDYYHYLFRTPRALQQFKIRSRGIMNMRLRLYFDQFGQIPIAYPPPDEQTAIVRYLDYMDRRVRRLVQARRKLIALLTEQKQTIIHRAVIRGLNPDMPLKDSSVEWIGEVPEHWEVRPLKFLVPQITVGIVIQPAQLYVTEGVPCLRSLNISSGRVMSEQLVYISQGSNEEHRKSKIFAGDIVVVRTGQAGVAAIVTPEFDGANCIDLLVIRASHRLVSEYLLAYLNSWSARTEVKYRSVGAIQAHYNTHTLANLTVPVPPVEEQREILSVLAAELEPIDIAITRTCREIELLKEYRNRLIADVVTGKLDVREAAAALPDVDPLAANGEPENTLDIDTEGNLAKTDAIREEDDA